MGPLLVKRWQKVRNCEANLRGNLGYSASHSLQNTNTKTAGGDPRLLLDYCNITPFIFPFSHLAIWYYLAPIIFSFGIIVCHSHFTDSSVLSYSLRSKHLFFFLLGRFIWPCTSCLRLYPCQVINLVLSYSLRIVLDCILVSLQQVMSPAWTLLPSILPLAYQTHLTLHVWQQVSLTHSGLNWIHQLSHLVDQGRLLCRPSRLLRRLRGNQRACWHWGQRGYYPESKFWVFWEFFINLLTQYPLGKFRVFQNCSPLWSKLTHWAILEIDQKKLFTLPSG